MAEQAAALAWALRLRALTSHLGVESNEQDLPIQSRIAQIEQSITQVVAPHASLRQLLAQGVSQRPNSRFTITKSISF